jgi:hypothetical protein
VTNFLIRILLAAALTLVAFALASSAQAQQADESPTLATARQQQLSTTPKSPNNGKSLAHSSRDAQTDQALAF